MTQSNVSDYHGCVTRTSKGRWLKCKHWDWYDEFGRLKFLAADEVPIGQPLPDWPGLGEYEPFRLVSRYTPAFNPREWLMFRAESGLQFRQQLNNYKLEIPFRFNTRDPRVPVADGVWRGNVGQMLRHLVDRSLSIAFSSTLPTLLIHGFGEVQSLPAPLRVV